MLRQLFCETSGVIDGAKRHFFLALMAALTLQACVALRLGVVEEEKTKEQVLTTVEPFYSWVLAHRFVSMPSDKERSELADFLTPEFIQLMKDAEEMEGRCVKATPEGEKGISFEGAFLVDNYEGATEVAYGELKTDRYVKGVVTLPVILVYIEERSPKASRFRTVAWNEELELRQKEGKWFINNINFRYDRSLRSVLQDYISTGSRECIVAPL